MNLEKKEPVLLSYLPSIYQERAVKEGDPLRAFLIIFEHFFSDIENTLDNIGAYFDSYLTSSMPDKRGRDFLSWLALWVNLSLDEGWSERKKRYLIKNAAKLYNLRGTLTGLKYIIEQFFDIEVELEEWVWPQGMEIGKYSSLGIDTLLIPRLNTEHCFKVTWKPPHPEIKPEFIKKIRTIIDLEKPAHTKCYFHLKFPKEKPPKINQMIIGINSSISFCCIGQEE